MSIFQFSLTSVVLILAVTGFYLIYLQRKKKLSYWRERGITYLEADCVFGSCRNELLQRASWRDFLVKCYNSFKSNGFGGFFMFSQPVLVVCNPNLIDKILIQDFMHFQDRFPAKLDEPLWNTLMNAHGEEWRLMRHKLIPSFTSRKVMGMFDQIVNCCDLTIGRIKDLEKPSNPVNVGSLAFVYSTEVIASCGFGIQLLSDDTKRKSFNEAVDKIFSFSLFRFCKLSFIQRFPKFCRLFGVKFVHGYLTDFFVNLTKGTIRYRKQNNVDRKDFLNSLMDLKKQEEYVTANTDDRRTHAVDQDSEATKRFQKDKIFTDDQIAALVFNFISAGLMPSATTISFALLEIARNPDIQKKVFEEIAVTLNRHKELNFDAIRDMEYLDLVIQETLRIYSFNTVIMRTVTEAYTLPETTLTLEKDLIVWIPVAALHMDPQRYPSPETFRPDRFLGSNFKPNPFFMPFGNGPRICIAFKFAILTVKVCLARILCKYSVEISEQMQFPLFFVKNEFYPKGGIFLSFVERSRNA